MVSGSEKLVALKVVSMVRACAPLAIIAYPAANIDVSNRALVGVRIILSCR